MSKIYTWNLTERPFSLLEINGKMFGHLQVKGKNVKVTKNNIDGLPLHGLTQEQLKCYLTNTYVRSVQLSNGNFKVYIALGLNGGGPNPNQNDLIVPTITNNHLEVLRSFIWDLTTKSIKELKNDKNLEKNGRELTTEHPLSIIVAIFDTMDIKNAFLKLATSFWSKPIWSKVKKMLIDLLKKNETNLLKYLDDFCKILKISDPEKALLKHLITKADFSAFIDKIISLFKASPAAAKPAEKEKKLKSKL